MKMNKNERGKLQWRLLKSACFQFQGHDAIVLLLCLSDPIKKGTNMNHRTMEYGWRQNQDPLELFALNFA